MIPSFDLENFNRSSISSCGGVDCDNLIVFTNLLTWFSLIYSAARLLFICHFLLQTPEEEVEDSETELPQYALQKKSCLWEMAGTLLISYETVLSFMLCMGVGSFFYEVKGFLILLWCFNYPVFLVLHWVLGLFMTHCCYPHSRMTRSSITNILVVALNLLWRGLLYWCGLNLLFHPDVDFTSNSGRMEITEFVNSTISVDNNSTLDFEN